MDRYIPSQFTSNTCEALLRCQSCRFIVKWFALLNHWVSCNVDSCGVSDSILSGCPHNGSKSLSVQAGKESSFPFSNNIPLWSYFSTIQLFLKPSTDNNFNQKTTSGVRWRPQIHISINLWNKLRDKILIEICECGRWTEFAKTSVCIILVVLVYLESAKIFTGQK